MTEKPAAQGNRNRTESSESDSHLRAIFDAMNDAVFIHDAHSGQIIDFNKGAETMFGFSRRELLQASIGHLSQNQPPFTEAAALAHMAQALSDGPHRFEWQSRRSDRTLFWTEINMSSQQIDGATRVIAIVRDIQDRKLSEEEYRLTMNDLLIGIVVHAPDTSILLSNPQASHILGLSRDQLMGRQAIDPAWNFVYEDRTAMKVEDYPVNRAIATGLRVENQVLGIQKPGIEEITWVSFSATPVFSENKELTRVVVNFMDISERKRLQDAVEKRIIALTRPLEDPREIAFDELFELQEIQRLQDEFADATGVASIITRPDGTPITRPSNFTRFCSDIIRGTEKGCANCFRSAAQLGLPLPDRPVIQRCLSGGLWDTGAGISVGGCHIASWLIGQVRDETQPEEPMRAYARQIGADEAALIEAFRAVPSMPYERFEKIANALFTLANQLSASAYQNIQQTRFITGQQDAENALRESESNYHTLINLAVDGILVGSREGIITEANERVCTMLGQPRDALIGKHIASLPFTRECLESTPFRFDLLKAGKTVVSERILLLPDSSEIIVEMHSKMMPNGICQSIIRDITARKQSEKNLRELTHIQSLILDNSSLGIALVENREFKWVNPRLGELFKLEPDKMPGSSTRIIYYSDEEYQRIGKHAYEELGRGNRFDENLEFQRHDGTLFWCRLSGKALDPENPQDSGSLWMFEDISNRMKYENELLRLSTAINQSPETVVITDLDGNIEYVNPAFEKISGFGMKSVLGKNPRILKSGQQDAAFYASLWKTISSGNVWDGRLVNRRSDGMLFTEEASIAPVKDANGNITNYVAVKRDISEELIREEELRQAQKMDAVGQLAGGIAHDFNNILQGILGFSQMLEMGLDPDSAEHQSAREIRNSAKRAATLTRQLLAFSRKQPAHLESLDLNNAIRDTKALLDMLLGEAYDIVLELENGLPEILIDPGQVTQILMNLAVNARDAMPDGGRLSISTQSHAFHAEDAALIPEARPGNFVCLSVADTGLGMDSEVQKRLFEPFFTTKEIGRGTGLGLSVIYGIVKQNAGWINVYSEPWKGSCFKIFVPVGKPDHGMAGQLSNAPENLKHRAILIVDDDQETAERIKVILHNGHYKTLVAANATEALALLHEKQGSIDLLISETELPGMRGDKLAEKMREEIPDLPVLLLSCFRDHAGRDTHMNEMHALFMDKPFTASGLMVTVHRLLENMQ
jgi:PAS domain S-box-containing protein